MGAADHIESLIVAAKARGEYLRFPHRFASEPDTAGMVSCACNALDALGVPFWKQNRALAYINNADSPAVWAELFRRQFRDIARSIAESTLDAPEV